LRRIGDGVLKQARWWSIQAIEEKKRVTEEKGKEFKRIK